MIKKRLFAPGPTMVHPDVLLAMARPIIHHRASGFKGYMREVREGLRWLFQTENNVIILSSTGTGGMEGSVSNFVSPGEKALVVNGGKFGERWAKICKAYGVNVEEIKVEWGRAVDPGLIDMALKRSPDIRAVYIQASETSTGVAYDVKAIADIVKRYDDTIIVVDAITALGVFDIRTDEWGLDVVVTGSQKALMLPPGLAFVSISEKAWRRQNKANNCRFYLDFKKEKESLSKDQTAYTASVSLIVGLREVLRMMKEEGLSNIFARHKVLAKAMREGVQAMGLSLFPKESPSDALTAIVSPDGFDGQKIYSALRERYGITAAGGQDYLRGKIFRVAHMGYADLFDVITAIVGIEMVLKDLGYPVRLGSGVKAAEELLTKG